jgi:hypothetical protein
LSTDIEVAENFERMNRVVEEFIKGNTESQIAKTLGIKRSEVTGLLDLWRGLIHNDNTIRERAKEALSGADHHYAMLINRAWETVEQADQNSDLRTKAGALKLIADIEGKRIDMLQKAGLLENNELSSQLMETERKQELLVGILKEVTSSCSHCKVEVAKRLGEVTRKTEEIIIVEQSV